MIEKFSHQFLDYITVFNSQITNAIHARQFTANNGRMASSTYLFIRKLYAMPAYMFEIECDSEVGPDFLSPWPKSDVVTTTASLLYFKFISKAALH